MYGLKNVKTVTTPFSYITQVYSLSAGSFSNKRLPVKTVTLSLVQQRQAEASPGVDVEKNTCTRTCNFQTERPELTASLNISLTEAGMQTILQLHSGTGGFLWFKRKRENG